MGISAYDVNVQLALATTAEHEGDYTSALAFLAEARRLSCASDRTTRGRVRWATARFRSRAML